MHDESMLELEEITDDDVYLFEVIESKYPTLKAAKAWDYADAISNMMRTYHPNRLDGWLMKAEALYELEGAEKAVEALLLDEERFSKSARYVYAIGRYTPWLMRYNEQESMSVKQSRWMVR